MTTKTIRHYEKVRLLGAPQRSEAGYRLYAADDLLLLQRVRRLQSLGLSLDRIKGVLGEPGADAGLREVLETLLVEVEGQLAAPEERQERIRETLDREDPELPEGETRAMKLAKECLGDYPKEASLSLVGQKRKIWATLEAFDCPEEEANVQESLARYYAQNPEEYRAALALDERLVLLADMPEDSPGVVLVWSGLLDPADAVLVVVGIEVILFATAEGEIVLVIRRYWRGWAAGLDLWAALEEGLAVLLPRKAVWIAALEPHL